ncbi:MAG: hypothetical protein EOP58_01610 [Sphingomonadales bacterium]|nr:MAG: hypothetical protein EOP58_01610 [Sphingomonadales bacterium]
MIYNLKFAMRAGAALAVIAVPVALLQAQEAKPSKVRYSKVCPAEVDKAAVSKLATAIRNAVAALPPSKASDQDIEAAIVYVISQTDDCPADVRAALAAVSGEGTSGFMRGVAAVMASYGRGGTGTAGVRVGWGGSYPNNGSFSAPVIGVGGGSANYTPS